MNTMMHDTSMHDTSQRIGWLRSQAVLLPPVSGGEPSACLAVPLHCFFDMTDLCTRDRRYSGGTAGEERSGAHRG
jgi:hypothetical protein